MQQSSEYMYGINRLLNRSLLPRTHRILIEMLNYSKHIGELSLAPTWLQIPKLFCVKSNQAHCSGMNLPDENISIANSTVASLATRHFKHTYDILKKSLFLKYSRTNLPKTTTPKCVTKYKHAND
jgi:hypothetical protein